jgi:acyl-CoA thioester hydrolase
MTVNDATFFWPVRVYYEDTDAVGIVYYANYLKFMERARTEWLRSLSFDQDQLRHEHQIVFAVTRANTNFRKPARLDDQLVVSVQVANMGAASFDIDQHIVRTDDVKICDAQVRIACLNADTLKPMRLPSFLLTELRRED